LLVLFNDTKSIWNNDRHCTQMTGNQHFCCSSNKNARKCKQENCLPTIPSRWLFANTWDCIRCKTAKRGGVNDQGQNKVIQ
jgi:hypothetical protein